MKDRVPLLGRGTKKKLGRDMAVSAQQGHQQRPPANLRLPAESQKIACYLLPQHSSFDAAHTAQIIESLQRGMPTPKSPYNHCQPAENQVRGHVAIRMHRLCRAIETLLTHLPASKTHKQRPDDSTDRVLEIRNQLDWQQGKGLPPPSAYKTRNGNLLLLELWQQFNGVAPVRGDLSITITGTTDRASGTNIGEKIDLTGQKRFLVFPNCFECVKIE